VDAGDVGGGWCGGWGGEQKASRLKSSLHFIGLPAKNKHTVFVEDGAAVRRFDAAAHFDTDASLLGRTFNRPRTAQLEDEAAVSGSRGVDGGDAGSSALKVRFSPLLPAPSFSAGCANRAWGFVR
jgi:hypothetical protein